jgi:hypothetical protein
MNNRINSPIERLKRWIHRKSSGLEQDSRWIRMKTREFVCSSCGQKHSGLFELAYGKPVQWVDEEKRQPNSAILTSDNVLTEDFCILNGEHFFVRAVLYLPIIGIDEKCFGIGSWVTLSKANFVVYRDTFYTADQGTLGPWFGWFCNHLKGYPETLNLKCQVHPQSGRQRPHIEIEPSDHPLAVEQKEGITFDRILDLYALNGHDIRKSLMDS